MMASKSTGGQFLLQEPLAGEGQLSSIHWNEGYAPSHHSTPPPPYTRRKALKEACAAEEANVFSAASHLRQLHGADDDDIIDVR